jgi:hypothetical protein
MKRHICILMAAGVISAGALSAAPALAQIQPPPPDLQNRIPAPLPPPPQAPQILGPETAGRQPGAVTVHPRRLDTHSDRVTRCLHEGSADGLRGGRLNAYARACANGN